MSTQPPSADIVNEMDKMKLGGGPLGGGPLGGGPMKNDVRNTIGGVNQLQN